MLIIPVFNKILKTVTIIAKQLNFNSYIKQKGRKLALTIEQILTAGIFKQQQGIATKKSAYEILNIKTKCSYKTFVVNLNRFAHLAAIILALIMKINQEISGTIKILDSTCVPVCQLKNSKKHKVMQGLAEYGKTGNGAYFGLKLHICATPLKRILSLKFTSGNTDDRKVVINLTKELEGLFLADAGYISKKLAALFNQENKRILFAKPRKNMKKLITEFQDKLYKVRSLVEINFRILKQFCGFITSLPKSVDGYLANYIYSLLAYQIF
jgi:hypothetical protein